MRIIPCFFIWIALLWSCGGSDTPVVIVPRDESTTADEDTTFFNGLDLSFQPFLEEEGVQYLDDANQPVEMLPFVSNAGVNMVRLRLWHSPNDGRSGLDEVVAYARRVADAGMTILLDIHYSDSWADPGQQRIPRAWSNLSLETMQDSVFTYTARVMNRFEDAGVQVEMVQIGNETNSGFLWDVGRVGGSHEDNWTAYLSLVDQGIRAVRSVTPQADILLHYAGIEGSDGFFGNVADLDYDVIGLSFYSIWHGNDLEKLRLTCEQLIADYDKKIMIVETAYPWTLNWNDWTHNLWGLEEQLIEGYPATEAGQKAFLTDLISLTKNLSGGKGKGIVYWAPDLVAYNGEEATDGSVWENAALFNFEFMVTEAFDAF